MSTHPYERTVTAILVIWAAIVLAVVLLIAVVLHFFGVW
jgi:hypothetical protein